MAGVHGRVLGHGRHVGVQEHVGGYRSSTSSCTTYLAALDYSEMHLIVLPMMTSMNPNEHTSKALDL
jgi:hypothetical protein